MGYLLTLCMLITSMSFAQAPLLLPTRSLAQELQTEAALGWRQLFLVNSSYQPIEEAWLRSNFLPKFKLMVQRLRMKSSAEGFDCDNFAELFRSELAVENHLAGRSSLGEVACGVLVVEQRKAFGRVLSMGRGGLHSLVLVRTDMGWMVIEPQTLRLASLDEYPNTGNIQQVYF